MNALAFLTSRKVLMSPCLRAPRLAFAGLSSRHEVLKVGQSDKHSWGPQAAASSVPESDGDNKKSGLQYTLLLGTLFGAWYAFLSLGCHCAAASYVRYRYILVCSKLGRVCCCCCCCCCCWSLGQLMNPSSSQHHIVCACKFLHNRAGKWCYILGTSRVQSTLHRENAEALL
jgi:hypothetical protein